MKNTCIKYTEEGEVLLVVFCGVVFYCRQSGIALDGWRDAFEHLLKFNKVESAK